MYIHIYKYIYIYMHVYVHIRIGSFAAGNCFMCAYVSQYLIECVRQYMSARCLVDVGASHVCICIPNTGSREATV